MAFRVGQKVVCWRATNNEWLVSGQVYTVIGIVPAYFIACDGLYLFEASHPHTYPCPFYSNRFRPVVSTTTGMAILEQIRRDVTNKELRPIWENA